MCDQCSTLKGTTANATLALVELFSSPLRVFRQSTLTSLLLSHFRMIQRNIDRIRHELEGSLEAVQLMDYDVKMRIRYINNPLAPLLFSAFELFS